MEYYQLANIPSSLLNVEFDEYFPQITPEDLTNGYVTRYFTRQANHKSGDITEIDAKTASRLKANPMYTVLSLEWRIFGPLDDVPGPPNLNTPTRLRTGVLTANRITLEEAEKTLPGIRYRLRDLMQFWKGEK